MVGLGLKGRINDGDESEAWRAALDVYNVQREEG